MQGCGFLFSRGHGKQGLAGIDSSWTQTVRCSLLFDSLLGTGPLSKPFIDMLLMEDKHTSTALTIPDKEDNVRNWIVQGVPRRPLYRELAYRLEQWSQQYHDPGFSAVDPVHSNFQVPAEALGFQELDSTHSLMPPTPPRNAFGARQWIQEAGAPGVLRILGMRQTVGSDPTGTMVIPSHSVLLAAAERPHAPSTTLTVGARARSKHTPRTMANNANQPQTSYFGVAKGRPETQNRETQRILRRMLNQAVWINCHTFGGLANSTIVAELRVVSGYGARWTLPSCTNATAVAEEDQVHFRGFLEPQMENGHELRWRH